MARIRIRRRLITSVRNVCHHSGQWRNTLHTWSQTQSTIISISLRFTPHHSFSRNRSYRRADLCSSGKNEEGSDLPFHNKHQTWPVALEKVADVCQACLTCPLRRRSGGGKVSRPAQSCARSVMEEGHLCPEWSITDSASMSSFALVMA